MYAAWQGVVPLVLVVPFAANLVFNVIFTPIQFGLKNNVLAALDVIAVWVTLVVAMVLIYPYLPWVTYTNVPYLAWVSFATILQLTITVLNWGQAPTIHADGR